MVNRAARDQVAELIRHLAAGQISNDEFEDRMPGSRDDPAVGAVFWNGAWLLYDDLREYKLVGKYRLPEEVRGEVSRWVLFLKSDLEPSRRRLRLALHAAFRLRSGARETSLSRGRPLTVRMQPAAMIVVGRASRRGCCAIL
jgi:hypothetical protein